MESEKRQPTRKPLHWGQKWKSTNLNELNNQNLHVAFNDPCFDFRPDGKPLSKNALKKLEKEKEKERKKAEREAKQVGI